jgi:hypothetical protein
MCNALGLIPRREKRKTERRREREREREKLQNINS